MATTFSRKKPARGLSGDTFESIFHHRDGGSTSGESSTEDPQQLPQPTSRRGGKRGGKKATNLGDFVEEMNSSFQGGIIDSCEQTVDSREISRIKAGDGPLRQPVRRTRSGRKPIKEEA